MYVYARQTHLTHTMSLYTHTSNHLSNFLPT